MAESADSSLTPEKRLLNLIEEPEALKKEVASGKKKPVLRELFSPAALKSAIGSIRSNVASWYNSHKASFGIKKLNSILKVIVLVLTVVFVADFILGLMGLEQDFTSSIKVPDSKMFDLPETKDAAKSEATVDNWDLGKMFMPYGKRLEEAERIKKEQSSRLVDLTKTLKLTGISLNPQDPTKGFCMIEDVEKNITLFLREGDPIGMLKVTRIEPDRVILESGDETVELH